jgi:hypothetical protein
MLSRLVIILVVLPTERGDAIGRGDRPPIQMGASRPWDTCRFTTENLGFGCHKRHFIALWLVADASAEGSGAALLARRRINEQMALRLLLKLAVSATMLQVSAPLLLGRVLALVLGVGSHDASSSDQPVVLDLLFQVACIAV